MKNREHIPAAVVELNAMTAEEGRTAWHEQVAWAGFWIRLLAHLVDSIILLIVLAPLSLILPQVAAGASLAEAIFNANTLVSMVLSAILVIFCWRKWQATPGKMLGRIIIVDAETGGQPTMRQHIVRYVGYIASFLTLLLGYLWVAFDKRKQGLHDKLAGTLVVRILQSEEERKEEQQ